MVTARTVSTRSFPYAAPGSVEALRKSVITGMSTHDLTEKVLAERALRRRAVEAAIWGMPMVAFETLRLAFFHDAGAKYGDIVKVLGPLDWKLQIATPNPGFHHLYFNFNLAGGPLVLEVPAGVSGSVLDAWLTPLIDVGEAGGRFLIGPEGGAAAPDGYVLARSPTRNGCGLLRIAIHGASPIAGPELESLIGQVRLYPLSQAARHPPQRVIDMSGKVFDAVVRFDDSFFDSLARMVEEEAVLPRDLVAMGQLDTLGIGKDQTFKPTNDARQVLKEAAAEVHTLFMLGVVEGAPFWPKSHWITHSPVGAQTGYSFAGHDRLWLDERGMASFLASVPLREAKTAVLGLAGVHDSTREPLHGGRRYQLRVPPEAPARAGWGVTVYDLETAAFIVETPRVGLDSQDPFLKANADGSVDIYFGPVPQAGHESNWIYTQPGRGWFASFCFRVPEKALLDRRWTLSEIEPLSSDAEREDEARHRRWARPAP